MVKSRKIERRPCIECSRARLMQRDGNPVIAECTVDGERWVANSGNPRCVHFKQLTGEPLIEHLKSHI